MNMPSCLLLSVMCLITMMCHEPVAFPNLLVEANVEGVTMNIETYRRGFYPIMYLGKKCAKVTISKDEHTLISRESFYLNSGSKTFKKTLTTDDNISIFIDTVQVMTNPIPSLEFDPFAKVNYNSFPVLIVNTSDSAIMIGRGEHLAFVAEIFDEKNTWQPIEIRHLYGCGTDLNYLTLAPAEVAITMVPKLEGSCEGLMRLRLHDATSNTFKTHYNPGQIKRYDTPLLY